MATKAKETNTRSYNNTTAMSSDYVDIRLASLNSELAKVWQCLQSLQNDVQLFKQDPARIRHPPSDFVDQSQLELQVSCLQREALDSLSWHPSVVGEAIPNEEDRDESVERRIKLSKEMSFLNAQIAELQRDMQACTKKLEDVQSNHETLSKQAEVQSQGVQTVEPTEFSTRMDEVAPVLAVHAEAASDVSSSALKEATRQEVEELMRKQLFEPLAPSFWEVFMVCGASDQSMLEIVAAVVLLLMVIGMNVIVCEILWSEFANNDTSVAAATNWRRSYGHWSSFAAVDGESLVHRVCNFDKTMIMSASQKQQYQEAAKYQAKFAKTSLGMTLCCWCILVFFFLIWEEVQQTIVRAFTVWHIPRAYKTNLLPSDEGLTMKTISIARLIIVLLLCSLRVLVASALLYAGSLWLVYTENIEALILNSAALVFVLDIDELVYRIACPSSIKATLESIEPLARPSVVSLHIPLRAISTLIGSACALISFGLVWLRPFADDVLDLEKAFCGGETDFVVATNAPTGIVYAYSRDPLLNENKGALMGTVIDELIDGSRNADHISEQSYTNFQASVASSLNDMISRFGGQCRDVVATVNSTQETGAMMAALATSMGYTANGLTNCSQLNKSDCMMDLAITRLTCPETCGCSSAFEGFFSTLGCPVQRCSSTSKWLTGRANQPRTDIDVEVLKYVPQWYTYWESFKVSHATSATLANWAAKGLTEQNLEQKFRQLGCSAMRYFATHPRYWILHTQMLHFFCDEYTDKWRPLSIFCPDTCECSRVSLSTSMFCVTPAPVNSSAYTPMCPGLNVSGGGLLNNQYCGQDPPNITSPEGWYNCFPNAFNGKNLYNFTDASRTVWEIRWETEEQYNWGAYFLGQRMGLQRTAKWTLNRLNQQRRLATLFRQRVGLFFSSYFTVVPSDQGWLPRNSSTTDFDCATDNNITIKGADRYYLAPANTNGCPNGYGFIHYLDYANTNHFNVSMLKTRAISDCRSAAAAFGSAYITDENDSGYPRGCYVYIHTGTSEFYLNSHPTGYINGYANPVCERRIQSTNQTL